MAEALEVDQVLLERGQLVMPMVEGKKMQGASYYLDLECADLTAALARQEGKPVDEVLHDLLMDAISRLTRTVHTASSDESQEG